MVPQGGRAEAATHSKGVEPMCTDDVPEVESTPDECPACGHLAVLSDEREGGIEFIAPICESCRTQCAREASMDSFDREYERLRANGWPD